MDNYFFNINNYSAAARFAFGAICIAVILAVNSCVHAIYSDYVPMTLFLGAIVAASWFGGVYVGIFATILGFVIELTLYMPLKLSTEVEIVRALVYLGQGSFISYIFGGFHKFHSQLLNQRETMFDRLEKSNEELLSKDEMLKLLAESKAEIEAERNKAQNANQIKSLFLANMSHELRTPLVSILGYAELLKETNVSPEIVRQYAGIIERTGNNLLEIINDVLDLSKVEAGQLEVEKIPFSVPSLITEIHSVLKVKTEQKSLDLIFHGSETVPEYIISDPSRIRQILMNLIGNSIKFTKFGYIKIRYSVNAENIKFYVQDSGIGIPSEQQEHIFKRFGQGDSSISRKYAGTGLGLSLSKQLAQRLGGDLFLLDSEVGIGSTFVLTVPFEKPTAEQIEASKQQKSIEINEKLFFNKSILLVDDSLDNQFLIKKILSDWGCDVALASNGKEALEEVQKEKFDLILMDMQMPVMDGYTACQELTLNKCDVPIVALTASAMKEDRDRCLSVGCRDYVSKPVQKSQLFQTLKKNIDHVSA